MNIDIAPPLELHEADRLHRTLPHGLPALLRDFYVTASAGGDCTFSWSPDTKRLAAMAEILPPTIGGGPHFCSAEDLGEHQQGLFGWADVFDDSGRNGPAAAQTVRESVPLIAVGNGDYVAWHATAAPHQPQVIYISHESDTETESPIVPFSNTGEEFMSVWERLGYLGPEIWLLYPFVEDSPTKLLDSKSPLSKRWISFLGSLLPLT